MKACPYCKEEVQDDAIKCRYCQSNLLLLPAAEGTGAPNDRRVTYVVDTDLVRFVKFASAFLAIFVVVGAYLFGFKLENSLEKAEKLQTEFEKSSEELRKSRDEYLDAKRTLTALKAEVETLLSAAKAILVDMQAEKEKAVANAVLIGALAKELSPVQQAVLVSVKGREPDKTRSSSRYWKTGSTLRIRFIGGKLEHQEAARLAILEWGKFANLNFAFVTSGPSDIRVDFRPGDGSWSYVGTDAIVIPQDKPTVNFAFPDRRVLLHEWGHALGLIEEHLNPKATLQWNMELVRNALSRPPNNWTAAQIDAHFGRMAPETLGEYRDFDPTSVMANHFPPEWTGGIAIGGTSELSISDKELIGRIYPKK